MMCVPDDYEAEYETELDYLGRLNLFTSFEAEYFGANAAI